MPDSTNVAIISGRFFCHCVKFSRCGSPSNNVERSVASIVVQLDYCKLNFCHVLVGKWKVTEARYKKVRKFITITHST